MPHIHQAAGLVSTEISMGNLKGETSPGKASVAPADTAVLGDTAVAEDTSCRNGGGGDDDTQTSRHKTRAFLEEHCYDLFDL